MTQYVTDIRNFIEATENLNHKEAKSYIEQLHESFPKNFEDMLSLIEIPKETALVGDSETTVKVSIFEQLVRHFETKINRNKHSGCSLAAATDQGGYEESAAWEASFSKLRKTIGSCFYFKMRNKIGTNDANIQKDFQDFLSFYEKSSSLCPHLIAEELYARRFVSSVDEEDTTLFTMMFLTIQKISSPVERNALLSALWSTIFSPVQECTKKKPKGEVSRFSQDFLVKLDLISLFSLYSQNASFRETFNLISDVESSNSYFVSRFSDEIERVDFFNKNSVFVRDTFLTLFHSDSFNAKNVSNKIKEILFSKIVSAIDCVDFEGVGRCTVINKPKLRRALYYLLILDTQFFLEWWQDGVSKVGKTPGGTRVTNRNTNVFEDMNQPELVGLIYENHFDIISMVNSCNDIITSKQNIITKVPSTDPLRYGHYYLDEVFLNIILTHFKEKDIMGNVEGFKLLAQFSQAWIAKLKQKNRGSDLVNQILHIAIEKLLTDNIQKISVSALVKHINDFYEDVPQSQQSHTLRCFMRVLDKILSLNDNEKMKEEEEREIGMLIIKMLQIDKSFDEAFLRLEGNVLLFDEFSKQSLTHHELPKKLVQNILNAIKEELDNKDFSQLACVFESNSFQTQFLPYMLSQPVFFPLMCNLSQNYSQHFQATINYVFKKTADGDSMGPELILLYLENSSIFFRSLEKEASLDIARILNKLIEAFFFIENPNSLPSLTTAETWTELLCVIRNLESNITTLNQLKNNAMSPEILNSIWQTMVENLEKTINFGNFDYITQLIQEIPWILEQPTIIGKDNSKPSKSREKGKEMAAYLTFQYIKKCFSSTTDNNYTDFIAKVLNPIYRNAKEQKTKQRILLAILEGFELLHSSNKDKIDNVSPELCWFLALALHELPFEENTTTFTPKFDLVESLLLEGLKALRLGENKNFDKCGVFLRLQDQQDKTETKTWLTHIMDRPRTLGSSKSTVGTMIEKAKKRQCSPEIKELIEAEVVVELPKASLVESQFTADTSPVEAVDVTVLPNNLLDTPMPNIGEINRVYEATMQAPRHSSLRLPFWTKRKIIPVASIAIGAEIGGEKDNPSAPPSDESTKKTAWDNFDQYLPSKTLHEETINNTMVTGCSVIAVVQCNKDFPYVLTGEEKCRQDAQNITHPANWFNGDNNQLPESSQKPAPLNNVVAKTISPSTISFKPEGENSSTLKGLEGLFHALPEITSRSRGRSEEPGKADSSHLTLYPG